MNLFFMCLLVILPLTKIYVTFVIKGFPDSSVGKEPTCLGRRRKRFQFRLWVGKIPWRGHGDPLQYSCLEDSMDRGAWWAVVHGIAKSQARLKRLSTHARTF